MRVSKMMWTYLRNRGIPQAWIQHPGHERNPVIGSPFSGGKGYEGSGIFLKKMITWRELVGIPRFEPQKQLMKFWVSNVGRTLQFRKLSWDDLRPCWWLKHVKAPNSAGACSKQLKNMFRRSREVFHKQTWQWEFHHLEISSPRVN